LAAPTAPGQVFNTAISARPTPTCLINPYYMDRGESWMADSAGLLSLKSTDKQNPGKCEKHRIFRVFLHSKAMVCRVTKTAVLG
jgi:hypothetical protein